MATTYGQKRNAIAHDLREQIAEGQYQPGDVLPAIPELIDRYSVARETVRDAISLLTNEGLVLPKRGRGTVVRETDPVNLHYAPSSPARTWMQQTQGAGTDTVTEAEYQPADTDVADRLQIPTGGQVVHRVRQFTKGHGIGQISDQWFPRQIADDIAGDLSDPANRPDTERNIFQLMADAGHAPAETTEDITARMPDPSEREEMELPPGVPVIVTRRVTKDKNGTPLETSTVVGASDRMSASFTVALDY